PSCVGRLSYRLALPSTVAVATWTASRCRLSLHDALPICRHRQDGGADLAAVQVAAERARDQETGAHRQHEQGARAERAGRQVVRSEEHTSELQSRENLVCRLLLEKKKETDTGWAHVGAAR